MLIFYSQGCLMKQNIKKLLDELMALAVTGKATASTQANGILRVMREEYERLNKGEYLNKQTLMISLFMGGTILALDHDDCEYQYRRQFTLYPVKTVEEAQITSLETLLEQIYTTGRTAILHLPTSFNGNLFKIRGRLINTTEPQPFFPQLELNAEKVDLLVSFCRKNPFNLDRAEFDIADPQSNVVASPSLNSGPIAPKKADQDNPVETLVPKTEVILPVAGSVSKSVLSGTVNSSPVPPQDDASKPPLPPFKLPNAALSGTGVPSDSSNGSPAPLFVSQDKPVTSPRSPELERLVRDSNSLASELSNMDNDMRTLQNALNAHKDVLGDDEDEEHQEDLPKTEVPHSKQKDNKENSACMKGVNMQLLGGFIAVLGSAAVATAIIALHSAALATGGMLVAATGLAICLAGCGFFASGTGAGKQNAPDQSLDRTINVQQ